MSIIAKQIEKPSSKQSSGRKVVKKRKTLAKHSSKTQVEAGTVRLVPGSGSAGHGGELGGHYWHIQVVGKRAGNVFINSIAHEILGRHASIQIHVNQDQRGRGIGRVAYRLACEMSEYDEVFAHMRKSNTPSRRAAEAAGFVAVNNRLITQLTMVWHRP